jgi:secreted trypsin-like serine protease
MRSLAVLFVVFALGEARPNLGLNIPVASFGSLGVDNYIIGGSSATPGAWPWQLSQQRQGTAWSHSCGASLLSSTKALSASHCVDGASVTILRVIAGLHDRRDETGTQTSNVASYKMHERYQLDTAGSYSNDIAILTLQTAIVVGGNIQLLSLPPSNNNFAGTTCIISGWGRSSTSNTLPDILQQAPIGVITTAECATLMQAVSGTAIWDNHICLFDTAKQIGSCNGDSGGPVNCPNGSGGYYVAGVTSWGISNLRGQCLQDYPSVYTRTSAYLDWIAAN